NPAQKLPGIEEIYQQSGALAASAKGAALQNLDAVHCQTAYLLDLIRKTPEKVTSCGPGQTNSWHRDVLAARLFKLMAKERPKEALQGLSKLLGSEDVRAVAETLDALSEIPGPTVNEILRDAIKEPNI